VGEAGAASVLSPILIVRMHPSVRRDLALLRELDQMHGGAYRPFLHDRHFSAASSFQIGVSRGRRIASSGMLALVSQRRPIGNQPFIREFRS
jgi:hypothetical protein